MIEWFFLVWGLAGGLAGDSHGIPEPLIQSIAWQESRQTDLAVSSCFARGFLQVRLSSVCRGCRNRSKAAELLHVRKINRFHGSRMLSRWLRRAERLEGCRNCRAAWVAALRGYNGGNRALRNEGPAAKKAGWYAERVIRGWTRRGRKNWRKG